MSKRLAVFPSKPVRSIIVTRPPNTDKLRDAIGRALQAAVKSYDLAGACSALGITPDEKTAVLSKWRTVLNWLTHDPAEVSRIADLVLERYPHFELEELVWKSREDPPEITELARRKLIDELAGLPDPWGPVGVIAIMEPIIPRDANLRDGLCDGHGIEAVCERFDMLHVSGPRFRTLLERLVDPKVRDAAGQKHYVSALNPHLRRCGYELRVAGEDTGYPIYKVLPALRGVEGRPKNIIFASSVKPDLRFVDAINNDIAIVSNADKILIYDRPIPATGLRWRDLQQWWGERERLDPADIATRKHLYRRLFSSLPGNSPPQQLFFRTFHGEYKHTFDDLPALLPEVWLHYDPKTVAQRGRDALLRQRMDFLMLFSHDVRIVIEVDGAQHYSDDQGRPSPTRYGEMVAADRELCLAGYEIYRFGGSELQGARGEEIVTTFFRDLFQRHTP